MLALAYAIGCVLLTWVLLGAALTGLGLIVQRAFGVRGTNTDRCLVAFWIGFAVLVAVVQVWSLVLPIGWHPVALLGAVGAGGLLWNRADLAGWIRRIAAGRPVTGVVIALSAAWIANQAIGPGDASDSGLYHYPIIMWANAYPAVPGLANLAENLGINNASLLYAAALNVGPWEHRFEHIANGLLLLAFVVQIIVSARRLARRDAPTPTDLYNVVLVFLAIMLLFSKEVRSGRTDMPPAVVICVMGSWLMSLLHAREREPAHEAYRVFTLCALAALAVCLKVTAILWGFFLVVVIAIVCIHRFERGRTLTRRPAVWSVAAALLLVSPWVGRNVILSGYPVFPLAALSVPVEWRTATIAVEGLSENVRAHGRTRLPDLAIRKAARFLPAWYEELAAPAASEFDNTWFVTWLLSLPLTSLVEVVLPGCLFVAAWGAYALAMLFGVRGRIGAPVFTLVPAAGAIVFWIASAPDPRFIYGPMWVLAATSVAVVCAPGLGERPFRAGRVMAVGLVLLCPLPVAYRALVVSNFYGLDPMKQIPFRGPGADLGFHPIPVIGYDTRTTNHGLVLNVPAYGQLCWRGPLPCVVWKDFQPDRNLRLRREGDLGGGFIIDAGPREGSGAGRR